VEAGFEWQCPIEGLGHASPVVRAGRVFIATAVAGTRPEQRLLAIDQPTGRMQWTVTIHAGGLPKIHPRNSHASATPACDTGSVFVAFANGGALHVTAVSFEGNILWQTNAGPFAADHGYGSSPVLFEDLVIVQSDSNAASFVVALDRQTGEIVWRSERPRGNSYATPVVAHLAGRPQLIAVGLDSVRAYDPATGRALWSCCGPARTMANTAACSDDLILCSGGFPEKEILCIRADGTGDVTDTHVLWRAGRGVGYVPSPLFYDGYWYVLSDSGTLSCLRARSGRLAWKTRLQGTFFASPVVVEGKLYLVSEEGKVFVVKTGPKYELLAENAAGQGCLATPAVCGGQLFLRTADRLLCIGGPRSGSE
jgi:outer membrane protein assembly factor BamB